MGLKLMHSYHQSVAAAVKTEATPTKLAGGVTVTRNAPEAVGLGGLAAEADPAGASVPQIKAEAPQGPASAPAHLNCSIKEEREAALAEPLAEAVLQGLSPCPCHLCFPLLSEQGQTIRTSIKSLLKAHNRKQQSKFT